MLATTKKNKREYEWEMPLSNTKPYRPASTYTPSRFLTARKLPCNSCDKTSQGLMNGTGVKCLYFCL